MIILIDNKEIQLNPDLISLVSDGNFTNIEGTFKNSMTFNIKFGEHNNTLFNGRRKKK
jgi:hypothetical protein